ncbi:MAG: NAD-dependent epimerase/dehydratase family protein [Gemmataceae bacterium]
MSTRKSSRSKLSLFHSGKNPLRHLGGQLTKAYDTRGLLVRMAVDLLLMNIAFFLGYAVTILFNFNPHEEGSIRNWIRHLLLSYWLANVPVFSACSLLAFVMGGMYSRKSRSRIWHKIRICARAVGLSYLFCIGLVYLLTPIARMSVPASALVSGLALSFGMIFGIRFAKKSFSNKFRIEPRTGLRPEKAEYILLIGGAGYIGSTLARQLLDKQYHVRVLDSLMFGDAAIRELYTSPDFEVMVGDFRNIETVVRAVQGMDAVIHLGAIVGDPACALDEELTLSINTHATRMIRDICCGYGVRRFLFASTCSVYGAQDGFINEKSPLAPVSLYARSKIEAEQALLEHRPGFHPTVLRLATAFGLSRRMRFDLVVNLLTARAITEGKITIFNGHQYRPFIQVHDIARAFLTCLGAPLDRVGGQVFNVGDNEGNLTLKELGDLVAELVPGTEVQHEMNSADPRSYRVDFSRIASELGFHCLTSVRTGIAEMIAAIKDGDFPEYQAIAFNNAAHLKSGGRELLENGHGQFRKVLRLDEPSGQPNGLHSTVVVEARLMRKG